MDVIIKDYIRLNEDGYIVEMGSFECSEDDVVADEVIIIDQPEDFDRDHFECYLYKYGAFMLDEQRVRAHDAEIAATDKVNADKARADAVLRTAQVEATAQAAAPDDVIALSVYLPEWGERAYEVGYVVTYDGQPYRCVQAHDSTGNPGWTPTEARSLWANYHAQSAEMALPWAAPTGGHDAYRMGEWMIWTDGAVYRCKVDNTVHGPDALPGAWTKGE